MFGFEKMSQPKISSLFADGLIQLVLLIIEIFWSLEVSIKN